MIRTTCMLASFSLALIGVASAQGSDDCATPMVLPGVGAYPFDLTATTTSPQFGSSALCTVSNLMTRDAFFVFTAPTTGKYQFKTCGGSLLNTAVAAYSGSDCSATCLEFDDNACGQNARVNFDTTAGGTYLLQVGLFSAASSPGTGPCDLAALPPPPVNNTCATATPIVGPGSYFYNRTYATSSDFMAPNQAGCSTPSFRQTYRDCFFQWTATADGDYTISNCGTGSLSTINVLEGNGCNAVCSVTSVDAGCSPQGDVLSLNGVLAGTPYLIQIGDQSAHSNISAVASLVITSNPYLQGDDCSDPKPIVGLGPFPFDSTFAQSDSFFGGDAMCAGPLQVGTPTKDLFFKWIAPWTGDFRPTYPGIWTKINVYLGADCNATCLASGTHQNALAPEPTFSAIAGQTYLFQMGSREVGGAAFLSDFEIEVLSLAPAGPNVEVVCRPAAEHGQGGVATLETSSLSGAGGNGLRLRCTDGPTGEFGFYLMSASATGHLPIENGVLCLDAPFARYNGQLAGAMGIPAMNSLGRFDLNGAMQYLAGPQAGGTDFDVPADIPGGFPGQQFLPGDVRYFQCWYRDPVPGGGASNLSDAARVTFP